MKDKIEIVAKLLKLGYIDNAQAVVLLTPEYVNNTVYYPNQLTPINPFPNYPSYPIIYGANSMVV